MTRPTCLVVITLFVLGCSAAFGQGGVQFGLLSNDRGTQYCDYEAFLASPAPYAGGVHVLRDCGSSYDGTFVGFRNNVPASASLPVTGGEVYVLADSSADALCDCFTGTQVMWVTRTYAYNPKVPKFGWEYFYNGYESFNEYLGNWGYLTTQLGPTPGNAPVKKSSLQAMSLDRNMIKK